MRDASERFSRERGSGLIVVIMVVAFMLAVGMLLLTVTGTSPKISDNIRLQGMAFDAAEAGFNAAWGLSTTSSSTGSSTTSGPSTGRRSRGTRDWTTLRARSTSAA